MRQNTTRALIAALVLLVSSTATSTEAAGKAVKRPPRCGNVHVCRHRPKKHVDPIYVVAAQHHWDGAEVRYWLDVLWVESRSTLGHYDLWATNGSCVGIGQLNGGWSMYAHYGGDYRTALGQLTGDAGYISGRYGDPATAWEHEQGYGWY